MPIMLNSLAQVTFTEQNQTCFIGHCPPIYLNLAKKLHDLECKVIPGEPICKKCTKELKETAETALAGPTSMSNQGADAGELSDASQDSQESQDRYSAASDDPDLSRSNALDMSEIILETLNMSPWNLHGMKRSQKEQVMNRKIGQVQKKLQPIFAEALDVETESENPFITEEAAMAADMRALLEDVRAKILATKEYRKKIQLLTLIPKSWSISRAAEYSGATEYMVRKANALRDGQGILSEPKVYSRSKISQETHNLVRAIYEDDEYSRLMPGQKYCVTVNGVKFQKRLMLVTVKELFRIFKKTRTKHRSPVGTLQLIYNPNRIHTYI